MRYFLQTIQHNAEKQALNYDKPKVFDDIKKAESAYAKQYGTDMDNATLDGSINVVFSERGLEFFKAWGTLENAPIVPPEIPTEEVAEE